MAAENIIKHIEELTDSILQAEPSLFRVNVKIKPTNNIKVFIDGDNGIPIEKCVRINRQLYKMIEDEQTYAEGDFSLEVSSPGLEEPLKTHRQYTKNIGRLIEVVFADESSKTGKLLQVTEEDILMEETTGKGKKVLTQQILIPFINIKTTTVQIQF